MKRSLSIIFGTSALLFAFSAPLWAAETGSEATPQEAPSQPYADFADMTVGELIGRRVVSLMDEDVGDIEKIVAGPDQKLYAVLYVGGFLTVGDKSVAIPLENLEIREGKIWLTTAANEAMLEYQATYDPVQYLTLEENRKIGEVARSLSEEKR